MTWDEKAEAIWNECERVAESNSAARRMLYERLRAEFDLELAAIAKQAKAAQPVMVSTQAEMDAAIAETIERCAKVCETVPGLTKEAAQANPIDALAKGAQCVYCASAIRALAADPAAVHGGQNLTATPSQEGHAAGHAPPADRNEWPKDIRDAVWPPTAVPSTTKIGGSDGRA